MRCKIRFVIIAISSLLIGCGLSLNCSQTRHSEEPTKIIDSSGIETNKISVEVPKEDTNGPVYVGIKNPAGEMSVWGVSKQRVKSVEHILATYPHATAGCMNLYALDSWEDTGKLMGAFYKDLERLVWSNYEEISKLKLRIEKLEKKQSERIRNKDVKNEKGP